MKKIIFGIVAVLTLVVAIYGIFTFLPGFWQKNNNPLGGQEVKKANETMVCDTEKHSCDYYKKAGDAGNARVVITAKGLPVKGLEVDMAAQPGAKQYYLKLTDNDGVALFSDLPVGSYFIYFNGINFPREYGNSPTVPAQVIKDSTAEEKIALQ